MARLSRLTSRLLRTARVCAPATATSDLISQIQTPTLAWGDIKTGATPWYSDAGTTPAVPTDGVYRLTEHISGTNYLQQTTSGARPTLSAASLNGHSYMSFDGGDTIRSVSASGKSGDFTAEMVAVFRRPTIAAYHTIFGISDGTAGTGDAWRLLAASSTDAPYLAYNNRDLDFTGALTNWCVVRMSKTAGAIVSTSRLWIDGVEKSGSLAAGSDAAPALDAAAVFFFGTDGVFGSVVDVAAMIYYATPLASDALRAADDAAIADWYGI